MNKEVEIRYFTGLNDIKGCQLLFIADSEKNRIDDIMAFLHNDPILVVGDTKGFDERGVHILFYINRDNELRFKINDEALKNSGLSASSFLLDYANKD